MASLGLGLNVLGGLVVLEDFGFSNVRQSCENKMFCPSFLFNLFYVKGKLCSGKNKLLAVGGTEEILL